MYVGVLYIHIQKVHVCVYFYPHVHKIEESKRYVALLFLLMLRLPSHPKMCACV